MQSSVVILGSTAGRASTEVARRANVKDKNIMAIQVKARRDGQRIKSASFLYELQSGVHSPRACGLSDMDIWILILGEI